MEESNAVARPGLAAAFFTVRTATAVTTAVTTVVTTVVLWFPVLYLVNLILRPILTTAPINLVAIAAFAVAPGNAAYITGVVWIWPTAVAGVRGILAVYVPDVKVANGEVLGNRFVSEFFGKGKW